MILKKQLTWIALTITLILGLGNSIFVPSMPSMQTAFDATSREIQFSFVTYFGCYVGGLFLIGPISDHFGRRGPLLFGLTLYLGMTLLSAVSKTIEMFWFARGVQGLAGSTLGVSFRAILGDRFVGNDLAKAFSYTSLGYRIGPIIGPAIGGVLQVAYGWQSTFYALALVTISVIYLTLIHLKETHLDTIPISFRSSLMKYRSILKKPSFMGASICRGIQYGMLLIFIIQGSFYIVSTLGYSPITFGHIASGIAISAIVGIILNRFLLSKRNGMLLIRIGILFNIGIAVAQIWIAYSFPQNLWTYVLPIGLIFFFWGFVSSNMLSHAINLIPRGKGVTAALQDLLMISTTFLVIGCSLFIPFERPYAFSLYFGGLVLLVAIVYKWVFLQEKPQA